jgi:WD40 repeat protein/serine/threonine protein kinase
MADQLFDEKEVFNHARRLVAPQERLDYVQQVCGQDPAAQRRLLELLRIYEQERSFLEASPVALGITRDEPSTERPGTVIGPYKLLEQIGEGGMGLVFVAEQQQPVRRKVALKVIKPGMDTRQVVARFEAERQALALMDHPHIATVHDGGQTASGRPYFVMELVKGVPITEYCDHNRVPIRERLALFLDVCAAVQHAHQKGIIHRDLKPSNVLVAAHDGVPVVKVIDFGVAKAVGQQLTDKTVSTQFTQLVGTPLYMSPEQAGESSLDVDTRSDIYALGVLLYELLTGTAPFDRDRLKDAAYEEMRRIIRDEEPPRPSTRLSSLGQAAATLSSQRQTDPKRLRQMIRGDLDWIVMKCLEKDRTRRYETVSALALDIQRYVADEPVLACPPSTGYRVRKFARRNKVALVIASLAGVALVALAILALGYRFTIRLQGEQVRTQIALQEAETQRGLAEQVAHGLRREQKETQRLSSRLALERGQNFCQLGQTSRGTLWLARSLKLAPADDAELQHDSRTSLARWCRSSHALQGAWAFPGPISVLAAYPGGKKVLVGGRTARVLDLSSGAWDGEVIGLKGPVYLAALAPDGRRLVVADNDSARIWDLAAGKPLGEPLRHGGLLTRVAYSPDGKTVATSGADGTARLWDGISGAPRGMPMQHHGTVHSLAFSPNGKVLLTGCSDHTARFWDVASGASLGPVLTHQGNVLAVAFSPDGRTAATGSNVNAALLWDIKTGNVIGKPLLHQDDVSALSFSPDGKRVLTGSTDKTARVWDATSGDPVGPPLPHDGSVYALAFVDDGRAVLTGGHDGTVRLWQVAAGNPNGLALHHQGLLMDATFSPDGKTVLTASLDRTACLWDVATGKELRRFVGHQDGVWAIAFSPDGKSVLTGSHDKTARLWSVTTGEPLGRPLVHPDVVDAVAISPDGKTLVTGAMGFVGLWDAATGKPIGQPHLEGGLRPIAVSPDGKWVLTGSDQGVCLLDATTGQPRRITGKGDHSTSAVAFSPDGKTFLTAFYETVQLWKAKAACPLGAPLPHQVSFSGLFAVAFSPDSKTVATGGEHGTAHLWDAATGAPLGAPMRHQGKVWAVAFSPDGTLLLTGSVDGTAQLWDARTGQRIGPPLHHEGRVHAVAFSPDGKKIVTACGDNTARLWDLPTPLQGSVDRVLLWTEVSTGMELDDAGVFHVLDGKQWQQRRHLLEALGGAPPW